MKLRLLCVGRPKDPHFVALHDRYAQRLRALRVDYRADWVAETRLEGRYSRAHVLEREGRALRAALKPGERCVALERTGKALTSRELATLLDPSGGAAWAFVIGGPAGLDPSFRSEAWLQWSLSPLTLPHELARVVVVEQLYRAVTLQRGLPYHR